MKSNIKKEILIAMYESVDRMNTHWVKGNNQGVVSEKWLQTNLRKNFKEVPGYVE